MSPMLKSTGVGHFGAKFGRKGLIDVSQILTRFGKDMGLLYAKEIFFHLCTMHEHDRHTNKQTTEW